MDTIHSAFFERHAVRIDFHFTAHTQLTRANEIFTAADKRCDAGVKATASGGSIWRNVEIFVSFILLVMQVANFFFN